MTDELQKYESLSVDERFREAERAREKATDNRITVTLKHGDARSLEWLDDESIHLVVTSPPYWTLKRYNETPEQLGHVVDYEAFLDELDAVWSHCYRVLVPGGRLCCVVGDVCLSRREYGRHLVMSLHADISVRCRRIGFDNLNPIIWHKISNVSTEVEGGGRFLGKPFEPNAIIKNDIEFILMQRKPGGYRNPTEQQRRLSMIRREDFNDWFQQIWRLGGASTREHPAPFPLSLADRLVRMFSFHDDTVLDPFLGTGTTVVAAIKTARHAVGVEIDGDYFKLALERIKNTNDLLSSPELTILP